MKLFKNITLILTVLSISIISIIICSSYTIIETERFGSYAVFEYPFPDGMITELEEKELMINMKIKSLQKTNEIYWGNFPEDRKKMEEVFEKVIEYIEKNFVGFKGLDFDWLEYREDISSEWYENC